MREHGTKLYFGTGILKMYSETAEEYRREKKTLATGKINKIQNFAYLKRL